MNESKLRRKFHAAIGEEPVPTELESQTRVALKRQMETSHARPRWLPGLVAAMLAIAIVASLLAVGEYRRNHSQPATTPAHGAGPAVVYFQGPSAWKAVDWTGRVHGSVGSDHVGIPYQSPDGSRLLWSPQGVWQIVDASGRVMSTPDLTRPRGITWADDGSGVCVLNVVTESPPNGGSHELDFFSATGGTRTIASVTTQKGANIAACSPSAGRVVVTTASGYKDPATDLRNITFGELIVIDFKVGTVLHRQSFPLGIRSNEVQSLVVSHDGSLGAISTQAQTTIVKLLNSQVLARLSGVVPLAFSWDDQLLVVDGPKNRGEVLSVSTGQLVWSDSVDRVTQGAVADPNGSQVMLFVTTGGLNDLLVVSATGNSKVIATNVFPAQVSPCSNCSAF